MAKWYGKIGFAESLEYESGSWETQIIERSYYGDLVNNRWKRQNSGEVIDDINIANDISIVADPYAMNHLSTMAYVELSGAKWKVNIAEVQYPRIVLSLGGVWNGNTP